MQIFARGSSSPAFQVGFTSLQFGTPAAGNFAFSAPPGAQVKTVTPGVAPGLFRGLQVGLMSGSAAKSGVSARIAVPVPAGPNGTQIKLKSARAAHALVIGRAMAVKVLPKGTAMRLVPARGAALQRLRLAFAAHLPANMTAAQRAAALRRFDAAVARQGMIVVNPATGRAGFWTGYLPFAAAPPPALRAAAGLRLPGAAGGPTVLGRDWLTVAVFPGGPDLAILGPLLRSAKPVHGTWGSGRLPTTSLLSVLVTSNGKILVGAVTPAVLYADAAQVK